MKISDYRKHIQEVLGKLFGEEAPPLCDILLCNYLNVDKSELILKGDEAVSEEIIHRVDDAMNQLGYGVPVQYIIGSCWFYGKKITVGKGVFIPRSDTEILAQAAIKCIPKNGAFADICSGSGCISAAIADNRQDVKGYSLELSYKALPYTEKNTEEFPNLTVKRFDALDEDDYYALLEQNGGKIDVIVCNPPYIRQSDIDFLQPQVQFEPRNALDGGEDGLDYYRKITDLSEIILKDNGVLLYEVGYDQANDVAEIMGAKGFKAAAIKDLNGIERVVVGSKE